MNNTQRKSTADLTSNQFYGGMNRRFEKRAALLRNVGFVYTAAYDADGNRLPLAMFTRKGWRYRAQVIAASEVLHADRRAWREMLASSLIRGVSGEFMPPRPFHSAT